MFTAEEKSFLLALPATPYEMAVWKTATVQFNYHISIEKMHYSVPYEYIKHRVDVRMTRAAVEVFYQNHRICSCQDRTKIPQFHRSASLTSAGSGRKKPAFFFSLIL